MRLDFPAVEMVIDNKVVFNVKAIAFRLIAIVLFRAKRVQVIIRPKNWTQSTI